MSGSQSTETRIVTLTPSATEVVAALGAVDKLVGVDDHTSFPVEATRLPRVGSFLAPSLEAIVRLRPTLVVVDDVHDEQRAALAELGIATVACPMHSLADLRASLRAVGDRIGAGSRATSLLAEIDAQVAAAAKRNRHGPMTVLPIIGRATGRIDGLVAAGSGSWLDELLALGGVRNAVTGLSTRYPKLTVEDVLRAQPDVILDTTASDDASALADWKGIDVPAVRHRRVVALPDSYYLSPSPRIGLALAGLDGVLFPAAPPPPALTPPAPAPAP